METEELAEVKEKKSTALSHHEIGNAVCEWVGKYRVGSLPNGPAHIRWSLNNGELTAVVVEGHDPKIK